MAALVAPSEATVADQETVMAAMEEARAEAALERVAEVETRVAGVD